jgi:hypothetical protein
VRPPPLDLDAITARWKGYDGALTAVYSEEREAWVITAADDGCPDVGVVAEIETVSFHSRVCCHFPPW